MRAVFFDTEGSLRNGWKILGNFSLLFLFGLVLNPLLRQLPAPVRAAVPDQWISALLCLAAAGICLRMEGVPLGSIGFRLNPRFLRDVGLGTLGGFGLMVLTALLVWAAGGLHWYRTPAVGPAVLLKGAWLYLAVAFFEEILFRGYPFQRAVRGLGFTGAQLAFALFFAIGHWQNPGMADATKAWATLNIALAAVLLAFCWRRTGSLALPIGVHLGWNWTQGNLLGFGVSGTTNLGWWTPSFHGRPEWLTGGAFGLEASLPCVVVCGAAIFALWKWQGVASGPMGDPGPSGGASTASES